jgi:trehalose-6-phosphate synthase
MNLVAKEFVASRPDEDGVLILSQFAGSALELSDAVLFNPYAIDELADAIRQAALMAPAERKRRMQRMRSAVQDNNVYRWAGKILSALLKFEMPDAPAPEAPMIDSPTHASIESQIRDEPFVSTPHQSERTARAETVCSLFN